MDTFGCGCGKSSYDLVGFGELTTTPMKLSALLRQSVETMEAKLMEKLGTLTQWIDTLDSRMEEQRGDWIK